MGPARQARAPLAMDRRPLRPMTHAVLLDLHLRANVFQLLLHRFGIGLVDGFLDVLGNALDQVLRFLQAQAGQFAHHFDHAHFLVGRVFLQNHGELGLLLSRSGGSRGGAGGGSSGNRGSGGHAELLLHVGDQLDDLEYGHLGNGIEDFVFRYGHVGSPNKVSRTNLSQTGVAAGHQPPAAACFWSRTAASVRASFGSGSASVATNFWIGAFMTPISIEIAWARVGRFASFSMSLPGSTGPPSDM